jgi:hypothetical protein
VAHFVCDDLDISSNDSIPSIVAPSGWEWVEEDWLVDKSKSFGNTDDEGWVYGPSFERIQENIKSLATSGSKSATWLFRKRRWYRNCKCVSKEIITEIESRINALHSARRDIELLLQVQQQYAGSVTKYELQRLDYHAHAFQAAVAKFTQSESKLHELGDQLRKLRQFSLDVSVMEREHARRTAALSTKYRLTSSPVGAGTASSYNLASAGTAENNRSGATTPNKASNTHTLQFDAAFEGDKSDDEEENRSSDSMMEGTSSEIAKISSGIQATAQDATVSSEGKDTYVGDAPVAGGELSKSVAGEAHQSVGADPQALLKRKGHTAAFLEIFCAANDAFVNVLGNFSTSMNSLVTQGMGYRIPLKGFCLSLVV